jgi:hypothetical protein
MGWTQYWRSEADGGYRGIGTDTSVRAQVQEARRACRLQMRGCAGAGTGMGEDAGAGMVDDADENTGTGMGEDGDASAGGVAGVDARTWVLLP